MKAVGENGENFLQAKIFGWEGRRRRIYMYMYMYVTVGHTNLAAD